MRRKTLRSWRSDTSAAANRQSKRDLLNQIETGQPVPRHVAIIMDGNGRWAQRRGLDRSAGHRAGIEAVRRVVTAAGECGVSALTLYTFSVENWGRPRREVAGIMRLLYEVARSERQELIEKNVRLTVTGDIARLPITRRRPLERAIKETSQNTGLVLNLALNYGGRHEILLAVRQIGERIAKQELKPSQIDATIFTQHLQTNGLPDPDLLIRTSGEFRLSNFLLWQTAYTELYVTDKLWPDFNGNDFFRAIIDFQKRDRRFGRVRTN